MYWQPVYSFLRRQGNSSHDAEDLTQGFFLKLLNQDAFANAEEAKGRLRSYLLVALKRFAADEYGRGQAKKRGGSAAHIPIDTADAERRYSTALATELAPDILFERQWALALLNTALGKLRATYVAEGREDLFDALKDRFSAEGDPGYFAEVAARLGRKEGAVRLIAYRMRQRYRKILRSEIALTVDSPGEVDEELAHLFKVFGELA